MGKERGGVVRKARESVSDVETGRGRTEITGRNSLGIPWEFLF